MKSRLGLEWATRVTLAAALSRGVARWLRSGGRGVVAALLALPVWTVPTLAAEPPAEPQLRIEAGMHTAVVNRIATDAQGRWAVTASDDKTARVWDVATGQLLKVLRPPIDGGFEGRLNAVAMSPDGAVVAVAGWTKLGSDSGHTVYLFDSHTGQLLRRLSGLPNVTYHLAFSPDGRWLAATLFGKNGVRVWRWAEGSAPLVDSNYGDSSHGAHFASPAPGSAAGTSTAWLATSSWDGKLRLYRLDADAAPGSALKPVQVQAAPGGKRPFGVAFSPGGQRLAVGYNDSTRVDVLDGQTLALRYSPSTEGVSNGSLRSVAFGADGQTLAAAGRWNVNGRYPVRRWPAAGQGAPEDGPTASNTVMDLTPLPSAAGGGWLVAAYDPAWGVLQPDGRWQPRGLPPTADLRDSRGDAAFLLGDSGRVLQFGFEPSGRAPHQFDVRQRRLQTGGLPSGQPPRVQGLAIDGWINTTQPTLNGQPLKLDDYETSRSLALLPGNEGFVLGAEWWLRLYKPDGSLRWPARAVPGVVWGVNVPHSGDLAGKVIVASYGDGTIRWHRVSDGQEVLAFFPHTDRKRWVLWTPSGYFDASPGGEELIGWHLNRGADQAADFFHASRFRARFYRPDVIDRVLDTLDEAEALKQADVAANRRQQAPVSVAQTLPPVVEVLSGTEVRATSAQLSLRVRGRTAADAPVTGWRVLIDGERVPEQRGLGRTDGAAAASEAERDLRITVPMRNSEVRVFAENRHGVSTEAVIRVTWAGGAPQAADPVVRPRLFVLAIGVGRYANGQISPLGDLPSKDARDFVAAIRRQHGRLYESVEVKVLTDAQATRDNVVDALEWLQRQPRQYDVSMLFVSGHGVNDPSMGYLFLPVNADPDALKRTSVNWNDFKSTVLSMTGKRLVFMDTCHSGNALGTSFKSPYNDITGVVADLAAAENGVVVFASSTGRQLSIQNATWGNGAFTKALVEGINGAANANARSEITHKRLSLYVSDRVRELTGGRQSPVNPDPVGMPDFAIAVK